MKILLVGAGGREHAMAWKLAQESTVKKIYVAPGNVGTAMMSKCENIDAADIDALLAFAEEQDINLTFVGSEEWLAKGIVDTFAGKGRAIFGPHQAAAQLESSKSYAKNFMKKHGVRTAQHKDFTDVELALKHLKKIDYPTVIKADGLAAGKGVIIAKDIDEAKDAVKAMMVDRQFNDAGTKIVIEDFLQGFEASILAFTDGDVIVPMLSAKDHKKIGEGETGLNTGGMGVVCPHPQFSDENMADFVDEIMNPTLEGIKAENIGFAGVIFFGLMVTDEGVHLIEYNTRMGDPEAQAVLTMMNSSLLNLIQDALDKKLTKSIVEWRTGASCCVVAASKGYPESYNKGFVIEGLGDIDELCHLFMAGVDIRGDKPITAGGRVLNVVGFGDDLTQAQTHAYDNMAKITFTGKTIRQDIGQY